MQFSIVPDPVCPAILFLPMSLAWSWAALLNALLSESFPIADCFFKNSIASLLDHII